MKFMEFEFDRLDSDRSSELDVKELIQSRLRVSHPPALGKRSPKDSGPGPIRSRAGRPPEGIFEIPDSRGEPLPGSGSFFGPNRNGAPDRIASR
jgi:hypothetical protein